MSEHSSLIATLLDDPVDHLRGLDLAAALAHTLQELLLARGTIALSFRKWQSIKRKRLRYALSCIWGELAGWENAWGRLCAQADDLLAEVRGVQPFAPGCESACQALCLDGVDAWHSVWTIAVPEEDCPPAVLGQAPWSAWEIQRLVEGCLALPEQAAAKAAEITANFYTGEDIAEVESVAKLEIRAIRRLIAAKGTVGTDSNASHYVEGSGARSSRPQWDRTSRLLTVDGQTVQIATREAPQQFAVLDLLETASWPADGVAVPRTFRGSLKDAVDALNDRLTSTRLRILRLANNQRVGWAMAAH